MDAEEVLERWSDFETDEESLWSEDEDERIENEDESICSEEETSKCNDIERVIENGSSEPQSLHSTCIWEDIEGRFKLFLTKIIATVDNKCNVINIIFTLGTYTPPPLQIKFKETPGPTAPQSNRLKPIQCFNLFFTSAMWQFLVNRTSEYATFKLPQYTKQCSLYRNWKPVTVNEMKAFVGVILNMGLIQLQNIQDYWLTDFVSTIPFFKQIFSRDRFRQIFGMLHVGDIDHATKKNKIKPLLDLLLPIIKQNYVLDQQISVDESIISFKGRVNFKQYLKGKPNPWGIKAYVLADSKSGYMHNLILYYGKQTELIDRPDLSHTVKVVLTIVEYLKNKGYDLYTDRFYTSPILADTMAAIGFTLTGTVMSNRKGLPKSVKTKTKDRKGTIKSYQNGKQMVLSWTDKRRVLMLSTKYPNTIVDVPSR